MIYFWIITYYNHHYLNIKNYDNNMKISILFSFYKLEGILNLTKVLSMIASNRISFYHNLP